MIKVLFYFLPYISTDFACPIFVPLLFKLVYDVYLLCELYLLSFKKKKACSGQISAQNLQCGGDLEFQSLGWEDPWREVLALFNHSCLENPHWAEALAGYSK